VTLWSLEPRTGTESRPDRVGEKKGQRPVMVVPCRLGLSLPTTAVLHPFPPPNHVFLSSAEFQWSGRYIRLSNVWSMRGIVKIFEMVITRARKGGGVIVLSKVQHSPPAQ